MTKQKLHLEILPKEQRILWEELGSTPNHFTLYGGTALALQLGHRESIDFDFFSKEKFDPITLSKKIPYLKNYRVTQEAENTLSVQEIINGKKVYENMHSNQISLKALVYFKELPDLSETIKKDLINSINKYNKTKNKSMDR